MPLVRKGTNTPRPDWSNRDWEQWGRDQIVTPDDGSVTPESFSAEAVDSIQEKANTAATAAVAAHVAEDDPHAQYATDAAASALAASAQATAIAASNTAISAAITAHESAIDPHPNYLNQTRGDARYRLLSNELSGSKTYDPGNLADGDETSTTVTVSGAALGDFALASFSLSTQGIKLTAEVTATNTVTVNFHNHTGGALDLASGTLRARVLK